MRETCVKIPGLGRKVQDQPRQLLFVVSTGGMNSAGGTQVDLRLIIETTGRYLDFAGVAVMVIGALVSVPLAMRRKSAPDGGRRPGQSLYRQYRQLLGRSILLGLELLVAADIIRTVAVTPTRSEERRVGEE